MVTVVAADSALMPDTDAAGSLADTHRRPPRNPAYGVHASLDVPEPALVTTLSQLTTLTVAPGS